MATDIQYILRQKFDFAFKEAKQEAQKFNLQIKNSLHGLDFDNQVILIHQELDKVKQEKEEFKRSEYVENSDTEDWLFNVYSTRSIFLEIDETDILKKSIIIGQKEKLLFKISLELENQANKYNFDDFLNGKYDVFLIKLNERSLNTSSEDYIKIRNWQSTELIKTVIIEMELMQEIFRASIKGKKNQLKLVKKEKEKFDDLYLIDDKSPIEDLVTKIKSLTIFKAPEFEINQPEFWRKEFLSFCAGKLNYEHITPLNLIPVQEVHKIKKPKYPISKPPIIFSAWNKYEEWIEEILEGNINIEENLDLDYFSKYENTIQKGQRIGEERINKFEELYINEDKTKESYKQILFDYLEELRARFKKLSHEQYYHFLDTETNEKIFIHNCFFGGNIKEEISKLEETVILDVEINFCQGELFDIYENLAFRDKDDDRDLSHFEILSLLTQMVVDSDLFERTRHLLNQFMKDTTAGRKPFYFSIREATEGIIEVFNDALDRLQQVLDHQSQTKKILYIQQRLKVLRQRELQSKRYGWKNGLYSNYFKEFLEIEVEYIKETKDIQFVKALNLHSSNNSIEAHPNVSFNFIGANHKILEDIYTFLTFKINFINEVHTSKEDFAQLLTSNDLEKETKKIHLGCETVQFSYILEKMKFLFQNLNPTIIEKSGIFISKKGTVIKAGNLYKNKIANPKNKQIIDKFFKEII